MMQVAWAPRGFVGLRPEVVSNYWLAELWAILSAHPIALPSRVRLESGSEWNG